MNHEAVAPLTSTAVGLAAFAVAQWRVQVVASRTASLNLWRWMLAVLVGVWLAVGMVKARYNDEYNLVPDSITHFDESLQRGTQILYGRWGDLGREFRANNTGFQYALGVVHVVTGFPLPAAFYVMSAMITCVALLHLLELVALHTASPRVPGIVVGLYMLLPTALFWATAINKEALMLLGVVLMLRLAPCPAAPFSTGGTSPTGWAGLFLATFLRPHVAILWLGGIIGAIVLVRRQFSFAALGIIGVGLMIVAFASFKGDLLQRVQSDGLAETALEYQSNWGGDSQIIRQENPIPIVEGIGMLFLRPFPREIQSSSALLAGLEVWVITGFALVGWCFLRRNRVPGDTLITAIGIVSVLSLSIFFTYMPNLGYMTRQRLQAFPAILILAATPYLQARRTRFRAIARNSRATVSSSEPPPPAVTASTPTPNPTAERRSWH